VIKVIRGQSVLNAKEYLQMIAKNEELLCGPILKTEAEKDLVRLKVIAQSPSQAPNPPPMQSAKGMAADARS
jgi:hypothetical protein